MEIKLLCNCGQKFKFDVEPVNGQMPFPVNCPVCGTDGTAAANEILMRAGPAPAAPPVARPTGVPVRLNRPVEPAATPPEARPITTGPKLAPIGPVAARAAGEFSQGRGLLGALAGAALGAGAMYGFYQAAGFRFPLLGIGIGVLTGFGAKLLAKGTDNTLGAVSGAIALVAVVGTLYLMYGEFPLMSLISVLVSVSIAYQIASA